MFALLSAPNGDTLENYNAISGAGVLILIKSRYKNISITRVLRLPVYNR